MGRVIVVFFLFSIIFANQVNSQTIFFPSTGFPAGSKPNSVSAVDFNGDGMPDLAVANFDSDNISVLLNTNTPGAVSPTFSPCFNFAAGVNPCSVSKSDINGDGLPDLAVANSGSNTVSVLLNTTARGAAVPAFTSKADFSVGAFPASVSICDLNGDGKPDIAVSNSSDNSISVLLNTTVPGAGVPSFSSNTTFTTGSYPGSVSIGDMNGDGMPDLAVVNGVSNTVSVLMNTTLPGAATPSFASKTDFNTGSLPYSVSIGDINRDGMPDLAVANIMSNTVSVLLNTTSPGGVTPSFTSKTALITGSAPYDVSFDDINRDGKPDLIAANYSSNTVSVLMNITDPGSLTPAFNSKTDFTTGSKPYAVSVCDLNGDSKADLAVANNESNTVSVLLNTTALGVSAAVFSSKTDLITEDSPSFVSLGDLNGDGKPDLAVIGSESVLVFLNTTVPGSATPTFTSKANFVTISYPTSVSVCDVNGDGKPDLIVTQMDRVSVLLNITEPGAITPQFTSPTDFITHVFPYSVSLCDLNGDGKPDMTVATVGTQSVSVFLNTTPPGGITPTFTSNTDFATQTGTYAVSVCDLNGDGKPDLAATNYYSNSVSVFLNTTPPGGATPSFTSKTDFITGTDPRGVSICDLNGDGKPDLAVANEKSNTVTVLLNTTSPGATMPAFSPGVSFAVGTQPKSITIGDINGDGKPDLAVTGFSSNAVSVFLNNTEPGSTTPIFSSCVNYATGTGSTSVTTGDINGDGMPDLAVACYSSHTVSVLLNSAVMPLPVELTLFTASATDNKVTLNWNTATEKNNYGFEIERSVLSSELGVNSSEFRVLSYELGIISYEKIGFVSGAGNSNSVKEYSFIDNAVKAGRYSYRLRQIDNDGIYKYSGETKVTITVPKDFALDQNYPNPFNPTTTIKYDIAEGSQYLVTLRVFDIAGREVATLVNEVKEPGRYTATFDASGFASGIYYCRLQAGTFAAA